MKKYLNKITKVSSERGFTILELTVSMLIIGVISAIVFANYNAGRRQEALNRSAQRLAVAIRQAQNYALFSRVGKCKGVPAAPSGGYGVYITSSISPFKYMIFGDCDNGLVNNPPIANHMYDSSTDDVISTINVESGVQILSALNISLAFEPPIGKFYYQNVVPATSQAITLQDAADVTKQKTITISVNGSVSVQ